MLKFCTISAFILTLIFAVGCASVQNTTQSPAEYLKKGTQFFETEQYELAREEFLRGAAEARLKNEILTQAQCIKYLGNIYLKNELPDTAYSYYETADTLLSFLLNQSTNLPDSIQQEIIREQANVLNNKALIKEMLNEFSFAADDYERVLEIDRKVNNTEGEAKTLLNLGRAARALGIIQRNSGNEKEALSLLQKSVRYFVRSNTLKSSPDALMNLARSYELLSRSDSATIYYTQAAELFKSSNRMLWYGITLGNLGMLSEARAGLAVAENDTALAAEMNVQALNNLEQAVMAIENSRSSLTGEDSRAAFFENKVFYYEQLIRLLFRNNRYKDAFLYTERVKARSLADMLATKDIGKNKNYSLQMSEWLNSEKAIRKRLKDLEKYPDSAAVVLQVLSDYDGVLTKIKAEDPEYTALRTAEPPQLQQIQQLLNNHTGLVEFFIGKSFSIAFLITNSTIYAREIASSRYDFTGEIESLRNEFVHFPDRKKDFFTKIETEERKKGQTDIYEIKKLAREKWASYELDNTWQNKLLEFYGMLFGGEFTKPLSEITRLYIVPHGPLHHLPFNALISSLRNIDREKGKHLVRPKFFIEEKEIVVLPAAGILPLLQHEKKTPVSALIIGNPKYPPGWWSLDGAEKEADTVAQYFPGVTPLKRESATETAVKQAIADKDLVHFGTHGAFEEKALNSKIVFTPDAENDGYLTAAEIFNLRLSAQLVVLSACQSGQLGSYKKGSFSAGDDLVGLSRSLLFAGAENILATLWFVDDRATAEVMRLFYLRYIQSGLSIPAALREAQLAVLNSEEYPDWKYPFFWAPYFHTGTF